MTKKEQLIEYTIQDIIEFICNDYNLEFDEAMFEFYGSETFARLSDPETGLYIESSAYVYDLYVEEKRNGAFLQNEI